MMTKMLYSYIPDLNDSDPLSDTALLRGSMRKRDKPAVRGARNL